MTNYMITNGVIIYNYIGVIEHAIPRGYWVISKLLNVVATAYDKIKQNKY